MNQITENLPLKEFTEKAYLDYAMYVILDRALPHISDGLKPVQRRIIYAMSELGLKSSSKHRKSARSVGDVLGKFHPHSDTACYEAMVLMAQPFSCRYTLIEGQGNWGSQDDPKSFAAMRYTESRLSAYADMFLSEATQGTVDWVPNFDGTIDEPSLLPARLPNILLNGTTGIAVGMATDIPPHNLTEVITGLVYLIDNPDAKIRDLTKIIKGPDFPTYAEIVTDPKDIHAMYKTGHGSIKTRAAFCIENDEIIITALPWQVSGAKILEQIAQQMQNKKLPFVADLRDESDHENPTRLVIVPRSNRIKIDSLMAHLFATTDLEHSYRINLNMVGLDNRPRVKNLVEILNEWLTFRTNTLKRRLTYRLNNVKARIHLLEGLMIAYLNIDDVIHIIRTEDNPKQILIKKFSLSDLQVNAILEIKLRQLAKLEEIQIKAEQSALTKEQAEIQKILKSKHLLKTMVRTELLSDQEKYGDTRRAKIVSRPEAQAIKETEILPTELITVILSKMGWIRAAKGHEVDPSSLSYRSGDEFLAHSCCKSNQPALFLDSFGRAYSLATHTLPSARGQGEPLTGKLNPNPGAKFISILTGDPQQKVLLASDAGYGFITKLESLQTKNKAGKSLLSIPKGSQALVPRLLQDADDSKLALITSAGYLIILSLEEVPELNKGKGNKLIGIPTKRITDREEYVIYLTTLRSSDNLIVKSGSRQLTLKPKDWKHYQAERGRRGLKLPRGFQRATKLATKK